jgi:hypothetical protein
VQALALVLQHGFRWDRKGSALVRSVSTSWRNVHDRLLPRLVLGGWETGHPGAFPPGGCFGGGRAVTITKRFPALSVLMIERRHGERDASCPSWLFFVQGEALCSPPPKFTELQVRIVTIRGLAQADRKWSELERGTTPQLSRRTCTCKYGPHGSSLHLAMLGLLRLVLHHRGVVVYIGALRHVRRERRHKRPFVK